MQAYLIIQPGSAYERANLQKLRSYRLMCALKKRSYKWKPKGVLSWLGYLQCTEQAILVYRVWMVHYGEKMVTSRHNCWAWSAMVISMDSGVNHTREIMCALSPVNQHIDNKSTSPTSHSCTVLASVLLLSPGRCAFSKAQPLSEIQHPRQDAIFSFFILCIALYQRLKATIKPPAFLSTIFAR